MMSAGRGRGLDFFRADVPIYTLTFAKRVSPQVLLTRMGADPDSVALRDEMSLHDEYGDTLLDDDEPVVTTGVDGAWTWAWKQGGMHGLDERILCAVSMGTEAVVLHCNEKPMHWFTYAADGDILVGFHTLGPLEPTGLSPAQLDEAMRPLGLVPGQPVPLHNVLSLAENAFGLRVTPPGDGEERWSGSLLALIERP
ncbi:DUF6461 domain-containing protein [Streptomyces sp. NPDC050263]|uniref:DUF6461 domain-containing protein n=1 Tax=Streptomyces sp. NPDC050263 TaxID=3155037 RepID=UPI00342EFF86